MTNSNFEIYSPAECSVCHDRAEIMLNGKYYCLDCIVKEKVEQMLPVPKCSECDLLASRTLDGVWYCYRHFNEKIDELEKSSKQDQWEYMFDETDLDEFTLPKLKNYWDAEGEQGWELVSMVMARNTLIAAFKRKLTS